MNKNETRFRTESTSDVCLKNGTYTGMISGNTVVVVDGKIQVDFEVADDVNSETIKTVEVHVVNGKAVVLC